MNEEVRQFGEDENLVGILTTPTGNSDDAQKTAIVLLNAGMLHRVGPYRLYVELARKIAAMGFAAFRFDLSGKGDSLIGTDDRLYDERAVGDIRRAIDLLATDCGIERFVLLGLCAGADIAHNAAMADERINGVVFLDGYGYKTPRYYVHRYGPKALDVDAWRRLAKRKIAGLGRRRPATEQVGSAGSPVDDPFYFRRDFQPKETASAEIQQMVDRGVELFYVYTGGVKEHYYSYQAQFRDMFPTLDFKGKIEVIYMERADHTFPLVRDREALLNAVSRWMMSRFNG